MTANNKKRQPFSKFSLLWELIKSNKWKLIAIGIITLIMLCVGIIVGIKTKGSYSILNGFGSLEFKEGGVSSSFFGRMSSALIVLLICFGCSFSPFLLPISMLFIAYRGYLLGLNVTLILIFNGMSGLVTVLFAILPCHLIILACITIMYILQCKTKYFCKGSGVKEKCKLLLFGFVLVLCVCLIETLLLSIFSPTIILIL